MKPFDRGQVRSVLAAVCAASLLVLPLWIAGCPSSAVPITSPPDGTQPGVDGNSRPTFIFIFPDGPLNVVSGEILPIIWVDDDPDSNATINLYLDPDSTPGSGNEILILSGRQEDPDGAEDTFLFNTALVPVNGYVLRAIVTDGTNPAVIVEAPGLIQIVESGSAPQNVPPSITVREPSVDRSVANDDIVFINWVDSDPDNNAIIIISLDLDDNPNNDNPITSPGMGNIILGQTVEDLDDDGQPGNELNDSLIVTINVNQIPPRPGGQPYRIKATIFDGFNPPVHRYAAGLLRVLNVAVPAVSASGAAVPVDLKLIGTGISGATFTGFSKGAWLGSRARGIGDFDADGFDDFVMVARFGTPVNVGQLGQAFIVYGLAPRLLGVDRGDRFGGRISANEVSTNVSGTLIQSPWLGFNFGFSCEGDSPDPANILSGGPNQGIVDVSFISDVSGDGRPELVFGLPYVDAIADSSDYDPGDSDDGTNEDGQQVPLPGCYADPFPNNISDSIPADDPISASNWIIDRMGSAFVLYSSSRDNAGLINPDRLERTSINLENIGQQPGLRGPVGANDPLLGLDRPSGSRFRPGLYECIDPFGQQQGPFDGLFGFTVDTMPDVNNDNTAELIISAPRNELNILELLNSVSGFPTNVAGRYLRGSVMVQTGFAFHAITEGDNAGNSIIPVIQSGSATCGGPDFTRNLTPFPVRFEVFAEDPTDFLGFARFAGDLDKDSNPDIALGAPFADAGLAADAGTAYVIFGSPDVSGIGDILLDRLNGPNRPVNVLRIFGERANDHLGMSQGLLQDFDNNGVDDMFIACGDCDVPDPLNPGLFKANAGAVAVLLGQAGFQGLNYQDYTFSQIGISLPGLIFYGANAGDRAGGGTNALGLIEQHAVAGSGFYEDSLTFPFEIVSRGADWNGDGFGDLAIVAPGATGFAEGQSRPGVVYVIFGGQHLQWDPTTPSNNVYTLDQVGTAALPGIVFVSPFEVGTLDEAAPTTAAWLGDVNGDGFSDLMIGNPLADLVADTPNLPRTDDTGEAYLIYGSNTGLNNLNAWP